MQRTDRQTTLVVPILISRAPYCFCVRNGVEGKKLHGYLWGTQCQPTIHSLELSDLHFKGSDILLSKLHVVDLHCLAFCFQIHFLLSLIYRQVYDSRSGMYFEYEHNLTQILVLCLFSYASRENYVKIVTMHLAASYTSQSPSNL